MSYENLKITTEKAKSIVLEIFNIQGTATQLPGEIDFNFRIKVSQGEGYILKISRPDENENYINFQQELLQHLATKKDTLIIPKVFPDVNGNHVSEITDEAGNTRKIRLLSWISGRIWATVNPQLDQLRYSLGEQCGFLTKALQNFDHTEAHRKFDWNIAQSLWTTKELHVFNEEENNIISSFQEQFKAIQPSYINLRKTIVHNDANDLNIIVSEELIQPKVKAIIDFGDAIHTQIINDVAISCSYAIMHHKAPLEAAIPLVKGYHSSFPLLESELAYLYYAIAMRLVIMATKSALNKIKEPDNSYLLISQKPAWELLKKWKNINPEYAHYSFRQACGFTAHPKEEKFHKWSLKNNFKISELFPTIAKDQIQRLDLSLSSKWIGHQEDFNDLEFFQYKINKLQAENPTKVIAGGYLEPRPIYTSSSYDKIGNNGRESRCIHLGVDFWLPSKTPVHALFDGEIIVAINDVGDKAYGGLVILKHSFENLEFYTLYGHLSVTSATANTIGATIKKGECIALLGDYPENGNWAPHLHFQIMLSLLDYKNDFPGVAYLKQLEVWKSLCPNPNVLFKKEELSPIKAPSNEELIQFRKQHLGKSLSLQYKTPIKMVRGAGQYILDSSGRKYLDTVNNVAHVGHEHISVIKAGQEQMALINTNSRYLHENINALAKELLDTLPPELCVVHFVNSGSEANELAIRMAKAYTGQKDIIASEVGYHGNTNMCIDISSYKFNGKGGSGTPEHTHIIPLPDTYRGIYKGESAAEKYAKEVETCLEKIKNKGRNVAAFIIEPIISCGGQIELPKDFLTKAYKFVRDAEGLCISDEVQVGCGRLGKVFWGFQLHNVIPDIITIGKPLGNGHPLAAVICTKKVAGKFANGMEYFNTFGGNPVSCAIGAEVLRTVKREKLQENALIVGDFLKIELNKLAKKFPVFGNVRGQGLFLGIELVDAEMQPLPLQTDYLANRMKDYGILMSIDGPDLNVLKIKPPMVFTKTNAEEVLFYLQKILQENFMQLK